MKSTRTLLTSLALTLSLTGAKAITFTTDTTIGAGDTTYDGQDIVVSNCTLTVNGPHNFSDFQVISNGAVTHSAAPYGEANNFLSLTIAGNLGVDSLSRMDVSGRGYAPDQGPGAGGRDGGGYGSGGGHGGVGGYAYYQGAGGGVYDPIVAPAQWGSGGGNPTGGSGGGAVTLSVAGTLRVDGALTADGVAPSRPYDGGGAGGSLWLNVGTLTGSGLITARGGPGGVTGGGGGGGGRVAFYFTQNTFSGLLSAAGAAGNQAGGAGTIYTKSSSEALGHLLVDNDGNGGAWTPLTTPEAFGLVIRNQGKASASAPLTCGTLLIQTNGVLSCPASSSNLAVTVLGDAGIDLGGKLDVSGMGYAPQQGPGAGGRNTGGYGTGAGHGGVGGAVTGYSLPGGGVYDSIVTPTQWGSGGGSSSLGSGGSGGSAVTLNVVGALRVDGALTDDGVAPSSLYDGGGAGGSLWITVGELTGSGSITARGAASSSGGGGGGGRIALYFTQNTFGGLLSAAGAVGNQVGGAGTIYTRRSSDACGLVLVDNGNNPGVTRLNSSNWPAGLVFDLTLSGAAIVRPDVPLTFRNLVLTNGAVVTHDQTQAGFQWTCLGDAWVASDASFNVNGLGYPAASGPGAGQRSISGWASGAGHGGWGQSSYWDATYVVSGGGTYGSSNQPVTLGSGGGSPSSGSGGSGGGALRLIVNGSLHLDGTFSANGLVSPSFGGGSGAGGSIWITASALVGNGSISALGGPAEPYGAAGGGGRIAINTYSTAGFDTNHISGFGTLVFGYPPPYPSVEADGSTLRVSWRTGSGASYQLWSTPDFTTWSPYGPPRTGTGGILTQDCPMTNNPGLFFRVGMGN